MYCREYRNDWPGPCIIPARPSKADLSPPLYPYSPRPISPLCCAQPAKRGAVHRASPAQRFSSVTPTCHAPPPPSLTTFARLTCSLHSVLNPSLFIVLVPADLAALFAPLPTSLFCSSLVPSCTASANCVPSSAVPPQPPSPILLRFPPTSSYCSALAHHDPIFNSHISFSL